MKEIFYFLSKTDVDVLSNCTEQAKYTRSALGAMVLFTGTLAFMSGSYAVSTIFQTYSSATQTVAITNIGILISFIVGLIYSVMIMAFDREIVSASNKLSALFRLPLAIIIGLVVALPLELKLLEDGIDKQLAIESQSENRAPYDRRTTAIDELNNKTEELEENVREARDQVSEWSRVMQAEVVGRAEPGRTGIPGAGPAYEAAKENKELNEMILAEAQQELQQHLATYQERVDAINEEYRMREVEHVYDLLTRIEALETIKSNSDAAFWLAWGIRCLIILLEIFPALTKLFLESSDYDAMLEARRRLNHQITNAIANQGLNDIETDINKAYNANYVNDIRNNIMK